MNSTAKPSNSRLPSGGVIILASMLIFAALYKLYGFSDYRYYRFMFQQLPQDTIFMRYIGSIVLRLIMLAIGIGLLLRKEVYRRLGIALSIGTICLLYWKHPYYVFHNVAIYFEYQTLDIVNSGKNFPLKYPDFPLYSMIFFSVLDVVYSSIFIYFFRNIEVKKQFS